MMKPAHGVRLAALLLVALAPACSSEPTTNDAANAGGSGGGGGGGGGGERPANELIPNRRVMIIGLDGVRPDAFQDAATPRMDSLISAGAVSFTASTQITGMTSSGPGWTSILTGVEVDKHQVRLNGQYDDIDRAYPSVMKRAQDVLGARISMASHWPDIVVGIVEEDARGTWAIRSDQMAAEYAADALSRDEADLYFVQLDDIDEAGHSTGFSSENPEYIEAIQVADGHVGTIIDAVAARPAEEEWLFLMTTDHGGEGTSHGLQIPENQTIWVIVSGDGVIQGKLNDATQMDLHPTALQWLGTEIDPAWELDGHVQGLAAD